MYRQHPKIVFGVALAIAAALLVVLYLAPRLVPPPEAKPGPPPAKPYDYYILINAETGEIMTYVSAVKVSTGDEYISADNKRYIVAKVEENRAYLRSFGPADGGGEKTGRDRSP